MELQKTQNNQLNFSNPEKNKMGELILPDFESHYTAMVIKTVVVLTPGRHTGQWTRTESPEINPYIYGQLIFDKAAKIIQ